MSYQMMNPADSERAPLLAAAAAEFNKGPPPISPVTSTATARPPPPTAPSLPSSDLGRVALESLLVHANCVSGSVDELIRLANPPGDHPATRVTAGGHIVEPGTIGFIVNTGEKFFLFLQQEAQVILCDYNDDV